MKNIGKWFALILLFCLISCASPPAMQSVSFVPHEFTRPEPSFKEDMDHIAGVIVASMQEHRWERIAIGDFKAIAGADTSLENSIADAITKNIGSVKGASVVEKTDSDRVLKYLKTTLYEMVHTTSDLTFVPNRDLIKKYRDKTYADIILGGTFTVRDEKIYLDAYFVDTKTGRIYQHKFDGIARNYNISQNGQPLSRKEMPELAKKYGCTACHAIERKVVGPAWIDVARKYRGDSSAEDWLVTKVSRGGAGVWGSVPEISNDPYGNKQPEIRGLIRFILSLATGVATERKQPVVGFYDLGGGVLKDSQTGLKWTQSDNGSNINWYGARNYCANLNGGWRLPSTDELQGIYDPSGLVSSSCGTYQGRNLTCKVSPLFRLTSPAIWSGVLNGSSEALFVSLYGGQQFSARLDSDGGHGRVLCVQGARK